MNKIYPAIITIVLAVVVGLYFFGPKETFLKHNCLLQKTGSCLIKQDGISLNLSLSPIPIIPSKDLTYQLKVKGFDALKVTMRVLGHDMDMPSIPKDEQVFDLETFLKKDVYKATRTFPTCTENLMIWRLYLVLQGEKDIVRTTFDLEVKKVP
ncbi:MAG: hypothetical protein NXH75_05195 [Halobacteriovoraceae bacterium]|nr:hypothetical protein [Halobacteriovoraceae bacterium]